MVARWEEGPFVPGPYADNELAALGDAYADAMLAIDRRRARSTSEFATLIAEQAHAKALAEAERDRLAAALRQVRGLVAEALEAPQPPAAEQPPAPSQGRAAWMALVR